MPDHDEENRDPFSGNELDDTEEEEIARAPEVEEGHAVTKPEKNRRRLFVIGAGVCLCMILGGFLWLFAGSEHGTDDRRSGRSDSSGAVRMAIHTDYSVAYESFIIPTEQHDIFTYVSFSIRFKLMNHRVEKEMVRRKYQLRGVIYDTLRKRIDAEGTVPTIEQLKLEIMKTVNNALSTGSIDDAYVTDFLAV